MPYKFNDARRHKFEKKRYRITNWAVYNESLRQRGDVTVWLSSEVEALWRAERRKTRGGQPTYSDLAITVCLTLGMVYKKLKALCAASSSSWGWISVCLISRPFHAKGLDWICH